MDTQRRMRILLSIMPGAGASIRKSGQDGESFDCLAHHFNGSGLLQVTSRCANTRQCTVFRFSKNGELTGVFELEPDGSDRLVYDAESGYGDRRSSENHAIKMLERLGETVTTQEEMSYWLG